MRYGLSRAGRDNRGDEQMIEYRERFCKFSQGGGHYCPDVGFTIARDAKGKPCGAICATCRKRRHAAQVAAKKGNA